MSDTLSTDRAPATAPTWDELLSTLEFMHPEGGRAAGEMAREHGLAVGDFSGITLHGNGPAEAYPILTFGDWRSPHWFQVTPLEIGEVTVRQRLGESIDQLIGLLDQAAGAPDLEPNSGAADQCEMVGGVLYDIEDDVPDDDDRISEDNLGWENPSSQLRLSAGEDDGEPSLGAPENHPRPVRGALREGDQRRWAAGATDEREVADDDEPSLASSVTHASLDQRAWAEGVRDDREGGEDPREDGGDDEPSLGSTSSNPDQSHWAQGNSGSVFGVYDGEEQCEDEGAIEYEMCFNREYQEAAEAELVRLRTVSVAVAS